MQHTINDVLRETTTNYLASLNRNAIPEPAVIEYELLDQTSKVFAVENTMNLSGEKWRTPKTLAFWQIAMIIADLYPVCRIKPAQINKRSYDLLALYQSDGPDQGIYTTDEEVFHRLAREYNCAITSKDFSEMMNVLRGLVPQRAC